MQLIKLVQKETVPWGQREFGPRLQPIGAALTRRAGESAERCNPTVQR